MIKGWVVYTCPFFLITFYIVFLFLCFKISLSDCAYHNYLCSLLYLMICNENVCNYIDSNTSESMSG